MTRTLVIREADQNDYDSIEQLLLDAFQDHSHSLHNEHKIVRSLRADEALNLELVADLGGEIIAYIGFSKALLNHQFEQVFVLAPLAVKPQYRNQSIATTMILAGHEALKYFQAKGCVVIGELDFYHRAAYQINPQLSYAEAPCEQLLSIAFHDTPITGELSFHPAFSE